MPARLPVTQEEYATRMEAAVVGRVGAGRYELWFRQHVRFIAGPDGLTVGVSSLHFREWLPQSFGREIEAAAAEVFGQPTPVKFEVEEQLEPPPPPDPTKPAAAKVNLFGERVEPAAAPAKKTQPSRRWKSLAEFVAGSCNRVAHASALAAVEEPGLAANPLVLYGPVGTGKTHLLEGIYVGLRKKITDARPVFLTAEEFTTRFTQGIRFKKMDAFRRQVRDGCALLIDDINFLAKKVGTQEELAHVIDTVVTAGRQVVVTTDCHPRLAEELIPDLTDRLLGGAVWGLLPPDDETRLNVLRAKVGTGGPPLPDDVLKYLARHLRGNVRELEGAVNGVRHFAKVTGRAPDVKLAREAVGDLLRHAIRAVSLSDIDHAVCTALYLPQGSLQSKSKAWVVTHPRMAAIFLARKHTAATHGEVARYFGVKTHSTAVAAEKKVRGWLQKEKMIAVGERSWKAQDLIDRVERELNR
ncbi:MAG TPA: DnaA/Hda family protein [Fimbriiglobus sp.]